jgi:hypothetical protein
MKRLPKAYSREKRKEQIKQQFSVWINNGDEQPKTMNRIAKALGMTPQGRIYSMLDELVLEGYLTCEMRDQSGRWTTKFYYPVVELLSRRNAKRRIVVKRRGVISGQLEMAL